MKPVVSQLWSDPDYLLSGIVAGSYLFARVTAATYRDSAFLDHRMQPLPDAVYRVQEPALQRNADWPRPPDLVIAHTGFCASTLLSRCLDSHRTLILREPQVLVELANQLRLAGRNGQGDLLLQRLRCCWHLLGKRYRDSQRVVVKPSNYANNLLAGLMRAAPACKLLLLYGELPDFLLSMRRHQHEAETSLTKFLQAMLLDENRPEAMANMAGHADLLQQAAVVWTLQIRRFHAVAVQFPDGDRIRVLPSIEFISEPMRHVAALERWLGIETGEQNLRRRIDNAFSGDAKGRGGSGTDATRAVRERLYAEMRGGIDETIAWARSQGLCVDAGPLLQLVPKL